MISDSTTTNRLALADAAPAAATVSTFPGANASLAPALSRSVVQPIRNVLAYLEERAPVRHFDQEPALYITLPQAVRAEVAGLLLACGQVKHYKSVHAGCVAMVGKYAHRCWSVKRFRALFDAWNKAGDWVALVNRSKAGALWQVREASALPGEFVTFCAQRFAKCKRADAKRQAWVAIIRQWRTGRNRAGEREAIPGYGFWEDWFHMEHGNAVLPAEAPLPRGWSYDNILRRVKKTAKFTRAAQALSHEGEATARSYLPQVHMTRAALRFMEEVQFDDVKVDVRVFDQATGEVMDLWLLVARDLATTMALGFGMRPARVREDGTQEHLKLRDMKQLAGWLLERYGLPPYVMTWKVENGTATFNDGTTAAIHELLGNRIKISFASMIAGKSPVGYAERGVGNSKGKASLESLNRLGHTIRADLPGATGLRYDKRPADLIAREKECREIWSVTRFLPAHLQSEVEYPLLTLAQVRAALWQGFRWENERTVHDLEGFETMLEWYDAARGLWLPQRTAPNPLPPGADLRQRKESPIERAARLTLGLEWARVSPAIITAFYEHTARPVTVENSGEIMLRHEGVTHRYQNTGTPVAPATKLLGYFHPDDPAYLHLTDGRGAFVGTWIRPGLVPMGDAEALAQALRYTTQARTAAQAAAAELAAPEIADLEAMRAKNAALLDLGTFVDVAAAPAAGGTVGSPVGAGLVEIGKARELAAAAKKQRTKATASAHELARAALKESVD